MSSFESTQSDTELGGHSFVLARSKENRRAYAKKRVQENASIAVPERVKSKASWPFLFEDESVVARFQRGAAIECLSDTAICDDHLELLTRLPPYPSSLISSIDYDKDHETVSAALYGYQLRMYTDNVVEQMRHYQPELKLATSSDLFDKFNRLLERFSTFDKAVIRYAKEEDSVAELICEHNAMWTARLLLFIKEDLQSLAVGDDTYVSTLYDRILHIRSLYDN